MIVPIPIRIIRLVIRELLYLKFTETDQFQSIGIGYQNATRACPFGRNMIDQTLDEIVNIGILEIDKANDDRLKAKYRLSFHGKELIERGNYEEIFKDCITTRKFYFTNIGEFGFSDIYERSILKWKLLQFEVETDSVTKEYIKIAEHLNYQIWKADRVIFLASNYLGHIRMFKVPEGIIKRMKLEIYLKGKEPAKIRLLISDSKLRGTIMEGYINEYSSKDYKQRIWEIENRVVPEILQIFSADLEGTKRFVNV